MSTARQLIERWRAMGPVAWAEHPGGWLGEDGRPLALYPWQRAALLAWWEHREAISTLALSNIKKSGKTALNALVLAWRWLTLPGEHYAAGNDFDQAAGRQFQMVAEMAKRHPFLAESVKIGQRQLVFEPTGSTLAALAVDSAGNAGSNHLTASHTEAWGILYENGIRSWEELTPPPGFRYGFPALRIADSYAGWEGESQTWHDLIDRGLRGERIGGEWPIYRDGGLLLFHAEGAEAQRVCFPGTPEQAQAYYGEQRRGLRPNGYARMHENRRVGGDSPFVPVEWWDRAALARPLSADSGMRVVLGVDAGLKRDSAAVVACAFDRERRQVRLVGHRVFYPQPGETLDLEATLEAAVRDYAARFSVAEVRFDPWQFQRSAQELRKAGMQLVEYAQTVANLTQMSMNLYELLKGENLVAYPDDEVRLALQRAVVEESGRGQKIAKAKSTHRIDVVVALAMAALGAVQLLSGPPAAGASSEVGDEEESEGQQEGHGLTRHPFGLFARF